MNERRGKWAIALLGCVRANLTQKKRGECCKGLMWLMAAVRAPKEGVVGERLREELGTRSREECAATGEDACSLWSLDRCR